MAEEKKGWCGLLMESLNCFGIAIWDFRKDESDHQYQLVELNRRY